MKQKPPKQVLENQYLKLKMSLGTLVFVHGVSRTTIKSWFVEYNIPIRDNKNEWRKFSTKSPKGGAYGYR